MYAGFQNNFLTFFVALNSSPTRDIILPITLGNRFPNFLCVHFFRIKKALVIEGLREHANFTNPHRRG